MNLSHYCLFKKRYWGFSRELILITDDIKVIDSFMSNVIDRSNYQVTISFSSNWLKK